MLERALAELMDALGFFDRMQSEQQTEIKDALTEAILEVADTEVYAFLAQSDWFRNIPGHEDAEIPEMSQEMFWLLQYRILYKEVARIDHGKLFL